jgi:cell division septum initiation protein DivIVA
MSSDKRKELMAALDAALRILNKTDEFEAANETQLAALEATRAEHEQEKSRLASTKAAVAEAEAAHEKWRKVSAKERTKGNAEVDLLNQKLRALEAQVTETQARHENIIAGIAALGKRLAVS